MVPSPPRVDHTLVSLGGVGCASPQAEVREGTLLAGTGDRLDPKGAQSLAEGDTTTVPAEIHHFWIASGRTVVALTFLGPFTLTYLRPEHTPPRGLFPFGY